MRLSATLLSLIVAAAASAGRGAARASPPSSEWEANPFAVDFFARRLAEAAGASPSRRAEEAAASTATAKPPKTCDEGFDDDATLAEHSMAKEFGLTNCEETHAMLLEYMDSADMLCKGMGANICNCTCAGTVLEPSVKTVAVPLSDAVDLTPDDDPAYSCEDVRSVTGEKTSILLARPESSVDVETWNCVVLGEKGVLLWIVDEEEGTIEFAAEFVQDGDGSAGIGISDNGGMYGADLMWVRKDEGSGEYEVLDMFSRGYSSDGDLVTLDDSQDVTLEWVDESDDDDGRGRLAFRLSRYVESCDKDDDLDILNGPVPLVWARFPSQAHMYHGPGRDARGTVYVDLLNPHMDGIPEDPSDLYTVDLRFGDDATEDGRYELEDGRVNSYACRSFELPSDQPYHVVSYEFIPDTVPADANVVHHIVLFGCDEDPRVPHPHFCTDMNAGCYVIDASWAVGIPTQVLPAEAGLPMKKFYYMQMHYENLLQKPGVRDASGLRITFTNKLREQDYAYIVTGTHLGRSDPLEPGMDEVVRTGFCPADCLAPHLPPDGITVHSQFFHSHLYGRSLETKHIRNGTELEHMGDMSYYDFNHQRFKYSPHQPKLLPGDEMITTCRFSTIDADKPVTFGPETKQEMCFNVFGYYPAVDMRYCWNRTEGGGRCGWGTDEMTEVTDGIKPYVPYEEEVPERCSAEDGGGAAVAKDASRSGAAQWTGYISLSAALAAIAQVFLL